MLDRITLTKVAVKGWNRELLGKLTFQYALREGVRCIGDDGSVSAVVLYSCLFDSLLYKFIEILDADELLGLPPSMIVLIPRAGIRTRPACGSF